MAASRGPVPKRSDQRRRVNKPEVPVATAPSAPGPAKAPAADPDWHPIARRWYESLAASGQCAWYQPSDWAEAVVWTELLSQQLKSSRPSAMLLAAWSAASTRLLTTEGDRRRVRIELERAAKADPDKEAGVASMRAWREKLAGDA
jgi:hypothetical protein